MDIKECVFLTVNVIRRMVIATQLLMLVIIDGI